MRAKYKLGNMVKVAMNENEPAHFGAIEGILLTEEDAKYRVVGLEDCDVLEKDILDVYRKVTPRGSKKASAPRAKKAAAKETTKSLN